MKHRATPAFWERYRALPREVQDLADRCFARLEDDPLHPSLYFKKVGRLLSARVGLHYRALAVEGPEGPVWYWIGSHAEYDRLLRG